MSRVTWLGSLYWRIALACLGLLAAGLAIQMVFVVATLSRPSGLRARITAQQLAGTVARDLVETLEVDPAAEVRQVLSAIRTRRILCSSSRSRGS